MPISVRIANPPVSLEEKFSKSQRRFYYRYARMVKMIMRFPLIQDFLQYITSNEDIDTTSIEDVRIMVFPSERKIGKDKTIAGTHSEKRGQISIYPLVDIGDKRTPLKTDVDFLADEEVFVDFVFSTSVRTLIEETLHTKYGSKYERKMGLTRGELEARVRELTESYFNILLEWMEAQ